MEPIKAHIRWMIRRDMPAVLSIEKDCFEFPWSEEDFIRCLRSRICLGMVAEVRDPQSGHDRIVGFYIYELHKARLHILNFAVHSEFQRRSIRTQMASKLIGKLSADRRTRIMLEIRETNLAAQMFFRSQCFQAVSVLREFYQDTPEDAYLFQLRYDEEIVEAIEQRRAVQSSE